MRRPSKKDVGFPVTSAAKNRVGRSGKVFFLLNIFGSGSAADSRDVKASTERTATYKRIVHGAFVGMRYRMNTCYILNNNWADAYNLRPQLHFLTLLLLLVFICVS